jgi:hypothetical protein
MLSLSMSFLLWSWARSRGSWAIHRRATGRKTRKKARFWLLRVQLCRWSVAPVVDGLRRVHAHGSRIDFGAARRASGSLGEQPNPCLSVR